SACLASLAAQSDRSAGRGADAENGCRGRHARLRPRRPLFRLNEELSERSADQPIRGTDLEELPHPRVRTADPAIRRQNDRRDDRAVLEQRPLDGGAFRGVMPALCLSHRLFCSFTTALERTEVLDRLRLVRKTLPILEWRHSSPAACGVLLPRAAE